MELVINLFIFVCFMAIGIASKDFVNDGPNWNFGRDSTSDDPSLFVRKNQVSTENIDNGSFKQRIKREETDYVRSIQEISFLFIIARNEKNLSKKTKLEDAALKMSTDLARHFIEDIKFLKRKEEYLIQEINNLKLNHEESVRKNEYLNEKSYPTEDSNLAGEIETIKKSLDAFQKEILFLKQNPLEKETQTINIAEETMSSDVNAKESSVPNASNSTEALASSSWSRLHVSPNELGAMPYGHFSVNIYAHEDNKLNQQRGNDTKKYFYAPMAQLNFKSAFSFFNSVTKRWEISLRIEMWNEAMHESALNFASSLVGFQLRSDQISILPLEKVSLINRIPSISFQIVKEWIPYRRQRFLEFSLYCDDAEECKETAFQIRNHPSQFRYFELHFSMSSQTMSRRETNIRIDNVVNGKLMTDLRQKFQNSSEVFIKAEDKKQIINEAATNIFIETFDDSAVMSPNSDQLIYRILENLLGSSRVIIKDQTDKMWDSVYWDNDNYRPDKCTKAINDFYLKLDKENQKKFQKAFDDSKKGGGSLSLSMWGFGGSVSTNVDVSSSGSNGTEELDKIFAESKSSVEWNGEKFVPKPMELDRLNIGNLTDKQYYKDVKFSVFYSVSILAIAVDVYSKNISAIPAFQVIAIKPRECYDQRSKIPRSCLDLECLGHSLNGFYSVISKDGKKLETIYCDFIGPPLSSTRPTVGAETRLGFIDIKTSSVYFSVTRNNIYSAANTIIPWELERLNIGGAMNLTTGVFRVPRDGIYYFSYTGVTNTWSGLEVYFRLDGQQHAMAYVSMTDKHMTASLQITHKLKRGNRVDLFLSKGALYEFNGHHSQFTGLLLEEDINMN